MSLREYTSRVRRDSGKVGRYVTPEPSSVSSSFQDMLGFIHDCIPQSYVGGVRQEREKVLWARFETSDCNDLNMEHHSGCVDETSLPLVLLLGLSNSFSVWMIAPGGDAREAYVHEGDPVRVAMLLQTPPYSEDTLPDHRPILAIVKKSNNSRPLFSSLVFVSLAGSSPQGKEIKRLEFEKNSIIDVKSNRRVIAVVLQKRLVVLDATTLEQKWSVKTGYVSSEHWTNPIALGTRWLALSDTKIYSYLQSVGGVSEQLTPPVASTVMNTVKKGFAAISDTLSGLTGRNMHASQNTVSSSEGGSVPPSLGVQPVVTILDLLYPYATEEIRVSELRRSEGVIAHFLAHSSSDVHLTSLAFNKSGELLFTADSEGQCFNIFRILPAGRDFSSLVQHLYSLYRGSTTGRVQDVCFSNDSRWIAVSTFNGTTHVFPISTYGGESTVRTHTSPHVVNQMSRFHTSAGIPCLNPGTQPLSTSSNPFSSLSLTPSLCTSSAATSCIVPVTVTSCQQIKQPYSSGTSSASTSSSSSAISSATGNFPVGEDKSLFTTCIKAIFTSGYNSCRSDISEQGISYSLYIINGFGELVNYLLVPQRLSAANDGEDAPIDLAQTPKLQWRLLSKSTDEYTPIPLDSDNPLIMAYNDYKEHVMSERGSSSEDLHVDEEEWLSEVELLTYAPPTRRLWMGPQFTFKTFSEHKPDDEEGEVTSPAAVLQPTSDMSELMGISHLGLNSIHTSPPSMNSLSHTEREKGNVPFYRTGSDPDGEVADTGVEVFGSWKDIAPRLKAVKSDSNLEQQILDAMKDGVYSPNDKNPPISLITGYEPCKTEVGFRS